MEILSQEGREERREGGKKEDLKISYTDSLIPDTHSECDDNLFSTARGKLGQFKKKKKKDEPISHCSEDKVDLPRTARTCSDVVNILLHLFKSWLVQVQPQLQL